MMKTLNKQIAVEPFPTKSIKPVTMKGGLIGVSQKVELTGLAVILDSEDGRFKAGMTVYVRGDLAAHDFTSHVQNIGGKTFILMPETMVQLISGE